MCLQDRSGIVAAVAPNIGPMIWDDIAVSEGGGGAPAAANVQYGGDPGP